MRNKPSGAVNLFYNTEHFATAAVAEAPQSFGDLEAVAKRLARVDANGEIAPPALLAEIETAIMAEWANSGI